MKTRLCLLSFFAASSVWAAEPKAPSVDDILKAYDSIMGPEKFEAEAAMTATRDDGSKRTYVMKFLKRDSDKFRIWFSEPSAVKGQEMLRNGENMWVYLPNLKRATRIANRDSFQGGDFNNADVLRVNYQVDYDGTLLESTVPDTYLVELKAKNTSTSYDKIRLFVRKKDLQPVRGEYFGTSGQMIRSAEFSDHKELDKGYVRPSRMVMKNELVKARSTEMHFRSLTLSVDVPPQRFSQSDLGK